MSAATSQSSPATPPRSPWLVAADLLDPPDDPYAVDPVGYARDVLGFHPWSKQRAVMESVRDHQRTTVRACHGVGKTAGAAQTALWFLATHRNSRVITTAPTWAQVEQLLWREIRASVARAHQHGAAHPVLLPTPSSTKLELGDQWFAVGLSTNEPERFQGHHADHLLLIVDEASGVDERIFEAAEGFLTAEGARVLLIGNPTRIGGQFHRSHTSDRGRWNPIHISVYDSPNLTGERVPAAVARALPTRQWVEEAEQAWGRHSPMFEVRALGNFPSEASNAVIPLHLVEAAQDRALPGVVAQDRVTIACDVARYGDDETVIATRIGNAVRLTTTYVGRSTTETTGHIITEARRYQRVQVKLVIDDVGVGGGVTDQLREQGWNVNAFRAGASAFVPDDYPNRRSEVWFAFADKLPELDLDADEQLAADLTAPTYRMDSRGRRVVEPKDETKKRLGRSPDRADAVLMTLLGRHDSLSEADHIEARRKRGPSMMAGVLDTTY